MVTSKLQQFSAKKALLCKLFCPDIADEIYKHLAASVIGTQLKRYMESDARLFFTIANELTTKVLEECNEQYQTDRYHMIDLWMDDDDEEALLIVHRPLSRPLRQEDQEYGDEFEEFFDGSWASGGFELSDSKIHIGPNGRGYFHNYDDTHPILNISRFLKYHPLALEKIKLVFYKWDSDPGVPHAGNVHLSIRS